MKQIFKVTQWVTDEQGISHPAYERFFTTKRKANHFIDNEVECMRGVASNITDKVFGVSFCNRSVKIFIGNEGYHTHYLLDTIEVE